MDLGATLLYQARGGTIVMSDLVVNVKQVGYNEHFFLIFILLLLLFLCPPLASRPSSFLCPTPHSYAFPSSLLSFPYLFFFFTCLLYLLLLYFLSFYSIVVISFSLNLYS